MVAECQKAQKPGWKEGMACLVFRLIFQFKEDIRKEVEERSAPPSSLGCAVESSSASSPLSPPSFLLFSNILLKVLFCYVCLSCLPAAAMPCHALPVAMLPCFSFSHLVGTRRK